MKRQWSIDIHQVLPVSWAYTSRCWKLQYYWEEGNNLSTLLSKCSTVKTNFSPRQFPTGPSSGRNGCNGEVGAAAFPPFPLWYFNSGLLCPLNRTLFEACFYSFPAWQTHTVRRQADKNHTSPAASPTVGVTLDTALHSSRAFSGFWVDSVPSAYSSSSRETRPVNPNENTSSTST